ncbi:tRNA synthetase class II (G H P and S) [Arcobacter nitrofigilis DSM 7299]|uniref:tRNA synthetase class II (G H P and S) n=1 Tax=Arcobacter nitrofigilis (strain ATCC 33309 / DSM 7299 / CCUG 15893 / LMG 7604 / NCTC 12251 / CI) TaxID=572480 RepID=D5V4U1_ARCNC|nr:ATP phosphoribosyltransferase regulatory subunit [Arcobacter nitrofigilis]ADG91903.1 tRNA synthetase class II (G H P and S) [Arcobacter nitrofigilis DSM 7299]
MIYAHEIPKGSRLYFGKTAKLKRELESKISDILYSNNFEEIVTPNFSYSQHQSIEDEKKLINFSDIKNNQVSLRADSSLDVVRIITKRLGRTTTHKKWFYIQPIFSYPSKEQYQIGCEWIDHDNISDILNLTADILKSINVQPILQLSNINIPKLVSKVLNIDIELFKNGEIAQLFDLDVAWLNSLIRVKSIEDLKQCILLVPSEIKIHLEKLLNTASQIEYDNLVIAPLYHGSLKYYDDVYFRVIHNNFVICKGGKYSADGISSLGFALYTDNLLKILED